MTNVLVPIADGTEEMEAVIIIDMLRRADIAVTVASTAANTTICASRKVKIEADEHIEQCVNKPWDAIILPGGLPGAQNLSDCALLVTLLKNQFAAQKMVAAICASPSKILGKHKLIASYKATGYPAFNDELATQTAEVVDAPVVHDKLLITSQGPGTAFLFALTIIETLRGREVAKDVADTALIP